MLDLTDREFEPLRGFLARPAELLGRAELVESVFDRPFRPLDRGLDMHALLALAGSFIPARRAAMVDLTQGLGSEWPFISYWINSDTVGHL